MWSLSIVTSNPENIEVYLTSTDNTVWLNELVGKLLDCFWVKSIIIVREGEADAKK